MAVSSEAAEKAVKALLKWKDLDPKSNKAQLLTSDDFVYLVVTLRRIPAQSRTNPYKLPLTHPLYNPSADDSEFCLFLDDRPDQSPTSKDVKAKIAVESIPLHKVIKFSKLKTDYKPFEAKRKLCDSYDMFLADRRIIPLLPKHLGKHFFKKKKIPVAVDLEHQNWKEQVERVCSSALLHLKMGTCSTVRVARSSMAVANIVENVVAAINGVAETVPNKWNNIRSLHLKLSDSVALPIYQSLPEANLIVAEESVAVVVAEGKKRGRGEEEVVLSSKKSPKTASSKKGRIHQVRYMDDATDKEEVKEVQSQKKPKAKNDGVDELDVDGAEEEVRAPKKASKVKNGVKGKSDGNGAETPKKSTKMKDELVIDGAAKKLAKTKQDLNLKAKVVKKKEARKVEVGEADGAKMGSRARKVVEACEKTDGAKIKKAKKAEVGQTETDGAKVMKKSDKVWKSSGDAKSAGAKKCKKSCC